MDDAAERQQVRFSVQTVTYAIEDMLKKNKTHLFYSNVVPGNQFFRPAVLEKHVLLVVIRLQDAYRGRVLISRTPGGIVADVVQLPPTPVPKCA